MTVNARIDDLAVYLHLARASERRSRPIVRDKLLVLASVAAARRRLDQIAQYCRHKVLAHNPAHLLGRWPSLATALEDEDFQVYLRRLKQLYPLEKAEHLLGLAGIELARERALYRDDHEYAAALLNTSPEGLAERISVDAARVRIRDALAPVGNRRQARRTLIDRIKTVARFWRQSLLGSRF
jgi:hypothetical protein